MLKKIVLSSSVLVLSAYAADNISTVKNSIANYDKSITIGQAFDKWKQCDSTKWENFATDNGKKVVQYTCQMDSYGKKLQKQAILELEERIASDKKYLKTSTFKELEERRIKALEEKIPKIKTKLFTKVLVQWIINVDNTIDFAYSGVVIQDNGSINNMSYDTYKLLANVYQNNYLTFK